MNADFGLLVLRVAIGGVVLTHGFIKIGWPISMGMRGTAAVRGVAGFFGNLGLWPPMFWAVVSIAAEIGGSLLMIVGLGGPIGPGLVFGDMVIVTIVAHVPAGWWAGGGKQAAGVEFPIPLAAGGLAVALIGNGGWSLDAALSLSYSDGFTLIWLALMVVGDLGLLAIRASRKAAAPQEPAAQS